VGKKRQRYADDFKQAAVARFSCTEDVGLLARELGINRSLLYKWTAQLSEEPAAAVRRSPSPRTELAADGSMAIEVARLTGRIGELERKIGRQQLDLDFFRAALQRVREQRRRKGVPGETASTR
jgi:transposase-like protein